LKTFVLNYRSMSQCYHCCFVFFSVRK